MFVPWRGSATFQRLDDFCKGAAAGLAAVLANGHAIVLAGDGDVGGLIGIHYCEEMKIKNPIVSIDGLELKEFDYIDIGAILDTSGAVPVVIKSLVFPASAGVGKDWQAHRHSGAREARARNHNHKCIAPCSAPILPDLWLWIPGSSRCSAPE